MLQISRVNIENYLNTEDDLNVRSLVEKNMLSTQNREQ